MSKPVRDRMLRLLEQRLERCLKLLRVPGGNPPDVVMSMNLWLVIKAALLLYGDAVAKDAADWLTEKLRGDHNLCGFCGESIRDQARGMCDGCWNEATALDKAVASAAGESE